jgi:drug/metabolite transporter (DMT)-like permease
LPTALLYAITVVIWGTSWYAMELQLVLPFDQAIAYRYALASLLLFGCCLATRTRLRFSPRDHLYMAAQGLLLFSVNYLLFYWAASFLVSGLLAVCFSTITVMNIVNGALIFRHRVEVKVAVAAVLGLVGIGLVFWPEFTGVEFSRYAILGLALSLFGTYAASIGNMIAVRHKTADVPILSGNAWGMGYGTLFTALVVLARGEPLAFSWSMGYLGSLVYLSVFASIIGFGTYMTLVRRIGADRAAYTSVLFPVVALAMSTWLEGYGWSLSAALGVALILIGNLLVLFRPRRAMPSSPAALVRS